MINDQSPIRLAALEHQLRSKRALSTLSQSHVHRAVREDSLGFLIGRDAILADWTQQDCADLVIFADFDEMIAFEVSADAQKWRGHRWVVRESGKIAREYLVEDRNVPKAAPPAHHPLGELRAGRGQYDAGTIATLPADFPKNAIPLVNYLHQAWNGRAFNLYDAPWLVTLVRMLPDATFYFERACVSGCTYAILWRVHGHHTNGQRIRLIGSSVIKFEDGTMASDNTLIDLRALEAQINRVLVDYA